MSLKSRRRIVRLPGHTVYALAMKILPAGNAEKVVDEHGGIALAGKVRFSAAASVSSWSS